MLKEINGVDNKNQGAIPPSPLPESLYKEMLDILKELYVEMGQESVDEISVPVVESGVINTQFRPKSIFYPYWKKGNFKPTFHEVVMEEGLWRVCGAKKIQTG